MPRTLGKSDLLARAAAAALLFAVIAVISGCGNSSEKFSNSEADNALTALDAVQQYVDEGRCNRARSRVRALAVQSTRINDDRPKLGEAYASSVARLQTLVERECVEITPDMPTPETAATGATGDEPTEPVDPTGGGGEPVVPVEPDNGNTSPGDGSNGTNGGGNPNNGDETPPADSGGAGPGT
ncbi:MAG: hypothetical protein HYX29_04015 [Solirubrobacterales bacterium]|nr:hypothetical protein [Solirubrobacterales bacterium]